MTKQTTDKPKPFGRPKLFPTVEYLKERIDAYFAYADNPERPKPYTLAGLAYYLGCDTETLRNYRSDQDFFGTIKEARQRIEMSKVEKLESKDYSTAGLIFDLVNNHGMAQKVENDHRSSDGSMTPVQVIERVVVAPPPRSDT